MSDSSSDPPPPGPPRPIPNLAWELVDNTAVNIEEQRARLGAALLNAGSVPLERVEATVGVPAEVGATVEAGLSTTLADDTISATGFVFPTADVIRLLLALPPQDEVERVFKTLAELRQLYPGGNEALAIVQKMITEVAMARNALRTAVEADQPNLPGIYVAAQALWRAVTWLGEQVRWIAGKLAEGALKAAGGWLFVEGVTHAEQIKRHAEQILTQAVDLEAKLTAIVNPIGHFFGTMHLPF